jgi:putative flippase GtrA
VAPPVADGFCFICHPVDLFNWISNALFGTNWTVSGMSMAFPVLTLVGVMLGALVASVLAGEFKWRPARERVKHFVLGFLTVNFGILLGACPIRVVLQSAYGDPLGLAGWIFVIIGVVVATIISRKFATRLVKRGVR